jgi:NCS2 family nucleobase:cation symporter-2
MPKKPVFLTYGLEDKPPLMTALMLGLQHVCILFIALIFPVLVIKQLGNAVDPVTARAFVSLSMISGGLTTIIQALPKGPVGSGYLCPAVAGPAYLSASLSAAAKGGLPLVMGMTLLAGVIETSFAPVLNRMRRIFTTEVTGVVVAMIGVVIIPLSVRKFLGITPDHPALNAAAASIGLATLSVMVALNVWSKGKLRLFCVLVGMAVGYALSIAAGILSRDSLQQIAEAEWFQAPRLGSLHWRFDFALLIPFSVATLCSSLKTIGDLVTCQKINDADWRRPDMKNVSKGVLADGLGGVIPGLLGGYGQSTSSSNVGLSIATGATSRMIAFACGGITIALAFLPKLANVFLVMPAPVMGASLVFSISFMMVTGFQMVMSRMLDARKTFIVGISIVFGLAVDTIPGAFAEAHPWIQPITENSLSFSAVLVVVLNLVLRLGIAKTKSLVWTVEPRASETIVAFLEKQGGEWGARREVIQRAASVMLEFNESAGLLGLSGKQVRADLGFDELNLDLAVSYPGKPRPFPDIRPTVEDFDADPSSSTLKLSGYLIHRLADRAAYEVKEDRTVLKLRFEH